MNTSWLIFIIITAIILSAFFAASEVVLVSVKETEDKNEKIQYWLKNSKYILVSVLILNNLISVFISSLSTFIISESISLNYYSIMLISIIISIVIVLLGEITPKLIAKNYEQSIKVFVIYITTYLYKFMKPIAYIIMQCAKYIGKIFNVDISTTKDSLITEKEILGLISLWQKKGVIEQEKKEIINGVFEFATTTVSDVLIPRTQIFALQENQKIIEVWNEITDKNFSRVPIYTSNIDNIIGAVYVKDLLKVENMQQHKLKDFVRKIPFVPVTKNLVALLKEFKSKKVHMAVAMNEYKVVEGIVTISDILRILVGDIDDEHEKEVSFRKIDNTYYVESSIDIEELNEKLGFNLIPIDGKYDTLYGFLQCYLDKVPLVNDYYIHEKYIISVLSDSVDGNKSFISIKKKIEVEI